MHPHFLDIIHCPCCQKGDLKLLADTDIQAGASVEQGVLVCGDCQAWFPIIDSIPILLAEEDLYSDLRATFFQQYGKRFGLRPFQGGYQAALSDLDQVSHYSVDSNVYDDLVTNSVFWMASDWNTLHRWISAMPPGRHVLDIGGGTGRCAIPLAQAGHKVVSFDISLAMVKNAIHKCTQLGLDNVPDFFVGNACNIPVAPEVFDYAIAFGILHHVSTPSKVISEASSALKFGGVFHGLENNASFFRPVFDLLMHFSRLWNEEAGEFPCLRKTDVEAWARQNSMVPDISSSTFIPPHAFNLLPLETAKKTLAMTDALFARVPFMHSQGGQLVITLKKANT